MLTNAVVAGALGAAYLTVIVLQLNPQVPLLSATAWRWYATLAASYGLHLAVFFYVLMVLREFFSLHMLAPAWVSVRVLAWLAAALAGAAAVVMWLNVRGFAAALGDLAARRMALGAWAVAISALLLLGIAIAHYSSGRRGGRVGDALFAIAMTGSLVLPLAARGPAAPASPPLEWGIAAAAQRPAVSRVTLLLLDGASLEYIWTRAAEGRLPHFARLIDSGAAIDLATIRPTQPDPVWAAAATGMLPARNGVRSAAAYYARGDGRPIDLLPDHCFSHALVTFGVVRGVAHSSAAWRTRPLWSILAQAGISVGFVRWPLTYPAPPVHGFLVADRFHDVIGSPLELDNRAAFPPDAAPLARAAFLDDVRGAAEHAVAAQDSPWSRDVSYRTAMHTLRERWRPQVVAVRYQALDAVSHGHWAVGEARPTDAFEADRRRSEQLLERAYLRMDAEVGAALEALAPDDLLLVISGFGMQALHPVKRLLGRVLGEGGLAGTHERAPDGFMLAYGRAVERGRRPRGAIVDVAPTVLYYLGLPVGRDMDGYARADLFTRAFTAERPIAFIPTHNR
jgi:predicted AlkP superfamily phosphohydrolase/phosphomutase